MGNKKGNLGQPLRWLNPSKAERRFKYDKKIKSSQKHSKKNDYEKE